MLNAMSIKQILGEAAAAHRTCDLVKSEHLFRSAAAMGSNSAMLRLAVVLRDQGRVDESLRVFDACLALDGKNPRVRFARSEALFHAGRFSEAWEEFESRVPAGFAKTRHPQIPAWNGEQLSGQTLLIE